MRLPGPRAPCGSVAAALGISSTGLESPRARLLGQPDGVQPAQKMLSNLVYTLPILQAVGARSWPRFWASLSSPHTLGVAAHTLPGSDSKLESTAMLRALGRSVHLAGVKPGRLLQVLRACGHLHRPAHHTSFVSGRYNHLHIAVVHCTVPEAGSTSVHRYNAASAAPVQPACRFRQWI